MTGAETLLGWNAGEWEAAGVWFTAALTVALALFAWRQIVQARELRIEQARPFVIAEMKGRSILVGLRFRNIGSTQARKVLVKLDGQLRSATMDERVCAWQLSPLFTSGMPTMAPGEVLTFHLDSLPSRRERELTMVISGTISYEDFQGRRYSERFEIDLRVYGPALTPEHDLHDLVKELKEIRTHVRDAAHEFKSWSRPYAGIAVRPTEPEDDEADT